MHGLVLEGPGQVDHRTELPTPTDEQATDIVVRVRLAGLCGSDLHPYLGRERVRPGVVPGHEVIGTVEATGAEVTTVAVGDRVLVPFTTCCGACPACRSGLTARCASGRLFGFGDPDDPDAPALHGGQAEYLRVPLADTTAMRIPDAIDDPAALLLTDNLPTAWEAVRRAAPIPDQPLIVVGLGAVGLCAITAAVDIGAAPVIGIDPVAARRAAAETLGATATSPDVALDAVTKMLDDRDEGAPAVVEAAGSASAQQLAFRLVRPGGTLSIIAVQTAERFGFTAVGAYDRNLTVRTGRASARATLEQLLPRVAAGEVVVPVEQVLTHLGVPLTDGPAMYRRFAAREDGLVKVAFAPGT